MTTVKRAVLLLVLATAAAMINADAEHEDCEGRNVTVKMTDLHKVYGEWVLVWAVSDHQKGHEILDNTNSSYVELKLQSDNKTIEYNERNMYLGKTCTSFFVNLTIPDDDNEHLTEHGAIEETNGVRKMINDTGKVDFLESCDDCMTMIYNSDTYGRYLLIYKRDGHHRDKDQLKTAEADHEKLAKCLHFPVDHVFIYDGVSDFCHKKSAPEEATEEH